MAIAKIGAETVSGGKAKKWLAEARRTGRNVVVWDSGQDRVKGFAVKFTPAGNWKFFLDYRSPVTGERRRITKQFEKKSASAARLMAADYRGQIANDRDPFMEIEAKREAEKAQRLATSEQTVAKLVALYLDDVKQGSLREYRRILTKYVVPALGERPVASLERRDVKALHTAHKPTPAMANRIVTALRTFLIWCADEDGGNCKMAKPPRELFNGFGGKKGWKYPEELVERFLSAEEFSRLGAALAQAERDGLPVPEPLRRQSHGLSHERRAKLTGQKRGPYTITKERPHVPANRHAVNAVRLLALTGWREQEALTLRWDAIDFKRAGVTLRNTKTARSQRQLGKAALALLVELRDDPTREESPYVFPGAKQGRPLREIKRAWYAARHAADLDDMRLHDLRHSFASFAADRGYSELVRAKLLGHAKKTVTDRYSHLSDEALRRAADEVSGAISAAMQGTPSAVVIPIGRGRAAG